MRHDQLRDEHAAPYSKHVWPLLRSRVAIAFAKRPIERKLRSASNIGTRVVR